MFRKFFLSFSLIFIFALYVFFQRTRIEDSPLVLPPIDTHRRLMLMNRIFIDGEFTGHIANAYYGYVQVKADISDGAIIDVQFLTYPKDRKQSIAINRRAMPLLKTEAIQAQNAHVDIVSGATLTSLAFRQSLSDALLQAKI